MLLSLYIIMTYAQLDTWSRGTKQSQTKPILPDLPLPSQRETALTSLLVMFYATTPQSQKQTQTNPISPPAKARLHLKPHLTSERLGFPIEALRKLKILAVSAPLPRGDLARTFRWAEIKKKTSGNFQLPDVFRRGEKLLALIPIGVLSYQPLISILPYISNRFYV